MQIAVLHLLIVDITIDVACLLQISLAKVRYIIFDEADRMLDLGFLPSMRKLVGDMDMPRKGEAECTVSL